MLLSSSASRSTGSEAPVASDASFFWAVSQASAAGLMKIQETSSACQRRNGTKHVLLVISRGDVGMQEAMRFLTVEASQRLHDTF